MYDPTKHTHVSRVCPSLYRASRSKTALLRNCLHNMYQVPTYWTNAYAHTYYYIFTHAHNIIIIWSRRVLVPGPLRSNVIIISRAEVRSGHGNNNAAMMMTTTNSTYYENYGDDYGDAAHFNTMPMPYTQARMMMMGTARQLQSRLTTRRECSAHRGRMIHKESAMYNTPFVHIIS